MAKEGGEESGQGSNPLAAKSAGLDLRVLIAAASRKGPARDYAVLR